MTFRNDIFGGELTFRNDNFKQYSNPYSLCDCANPDKISPFFFNINAFYIQIRLIFALLFNNIVGWRTYRKTFTDVFL